MLLLWPKAFLNHSEPPSVVIILGVILSGCKYCEFVFSDDEEEAICQESEVTKEMLDEYLVRLVTRELLDFVCKSALRIL